MTSIEQRLAEFFAEYKARINRALADKPEIDIEATARAFADCFIEANPNGVVCGRTTTNSAMRSQKASSSTGASERSP